MENCSVLKKHAHGKCGLYNNNRRRPPWGLNPRPQDAYLKLIVEGTIVCLHPIVDCVNRRRHVRQSALMGHQPTLLLAKGNDVVVKHELEQPLLVVRLPPRSIEV
jgi:hypothetical protein